jgi:hypothetical protein
MSCLRATARCMNVEADLEEVRRTGRVADAAPSTDEATTLQLRDELAAAQLQVCMCGVCAAR